MAENVQAQRESLDRRPTSNKLTPLRALAPFLRPYRWMILFAGLALIVAAGATLVLPAAVRGVIDHGFSQEDATNIQRYFLGLIAVVAVIGMASATRFYFVSWIGERVVADVRAKVFNHLLGESDTAFFAPPKLAARLRRRFPASLDGAPVLLPTSNTVLRRSLDAWMDGLGVRPELTGEFDDSALMMAFGARGLGVFAAPRVLEEEIRSEMGVQIVGRAEEVREAFYAITVERRLRHPALVTLAEAARDALFGAAA